MDGLHVLGPLEVVVDGVSRPFGGRRRRRLLSVLALWANRVVSNDRLVDLVWGTDAHGGVLRSLRTEISRLRQSLDGVATVEADGGGYRLEIDPDRLDVTRFEALVAEAASREGAEVVGVVGEALGLWRGEPFADLTDTVEAAVAEGQRLQGLWVGAVVRRAEAQLVVAGDDAAALGEVVGQLWGLVEQHPLQERLWALLMLSLYRSGRQAEALAAFQQARGVLVEDLGLEPSVELVELEQQILEHDPGLDAAAQESALTRSDALGTETARRPSGTVTFLFSDIEGSTALWEQHPVEMRSALERHDEVVRSAIEAHGGYVFSAAGDAFAAAFARAGDAVATAEDAQEALAVVSWPTPSPIRVRMGLHTGEAQERDGDYFGPALNRAARIMGAGHGGQVLVSSITAGVVGSGGLLDLGEHRLKDLGDPERLWQLGGATFPAPRVSAVAEVRLPEALTSFNGRRSEVDELAGWLEESALVSLVGPGGVGKTRLAIEAAGRIANSFTDGVWFTSFAEVSESDVDAVPFVVADGVGLQAQPGLSMTDTLVAWIGERRALLILDNCEHVHAGARQLVGQLRQGCPELSMLITSRLPLGVQGERRWTVGALDAPAARQLFIDRTQLFDRGVSSAELEHVGTLCDMLGCLPLAIELGAARCRAMTVGQLVERLEDHPDLIADRSEGRVETLGSIIRWSVDQLDQTSREVLGRLSVFQGGCCLEQLEETVEDQVEAVDLFDALDALTDAGLVHVERGTAGLRYTQLEPIRQHGRRLLSAEVENELRGLHLLAYSKLAKSIGQGLRGPDFADWADIADRELANLRAAHRWAIATGDAARAVEIVAGLDELLNERLVSELWDWNDVTVELTRKGADVLHAQALAAAGAGWMHQRRYPELIAAHDRLTEIGDAGPYRARMSFATGWAYVSTGRFAEGRKIWLDGADPESPPWDQAYIAAALTVASGSDRQRAADLVAKVDSPTLRAWHTIWSTRVTGTTEELVESEAAYEETVRITERIGAAHPMGVALYARSLVQAQLAKTETANILRSMDRAVSLWSRLRTPFQLVGTLNALAIVLAVRGLPEPAVTLFAAVDQHGGSMSIRLRPLAAPAIDALSTTTAARCTAHGQALTTDEALAFARTTIAEHTA